MQWTIQLRPGEFEASSAQTRTGKTYGCKLRLTSAYVIDCHLAGGYSGLRRLCMRLRLTAMALREAASLLVAIWK